MFMSYAQNMMEPVRWVIDAISDLITTQVASSAANGNKKGLYKCELML